MPYMYALYVCLICMPFMYALYVCLACMPTYPPSHPRTHVCLICMPYMYAFFFLPTYPTTNPRPTHAPSLVHTYTPGGRENRSSGPGAKYKQNKIKIKKKIIVHMSQVDEKIDFPGPEIRSRGLSDTMAFLAYIQVGLFCPFAGLFCLGSRPLSPRCRPLLPSI